ncbi:MAG: hypothetical protein RL346_572 [Verrucomicrobiota bacterium]|jgi:hypothetical protein
MIRFKTLKLPISKIRNAIHHGKKLSWPCMLGMFCLGQNACSSGRIPHPSPALNTAPCPQVPPPIPALQSDADPSGFPPYVSQTTLSNIRFDGVCFDSTTHSLSVIDQPNGPGSTYLDSKQAAIQQGALLAINAGFFTPNGDPLGLVISRGKRSGAWNSASSLGTGIYRMDRTGQASISRRSSLASVSNSTELLQAGPLLVENSTAIQGLDAAKWAMRSVLLHDGGNRWWVGITSPCSLSELSQVLANQSPAGWNVSYALNLDGGRSSDLFVSSRIPQGNFQRKSLMNRPVRNYFILTAKR